MRQETNNEMDLLLRRLGRRTETSASDVNLRGDGEHLDADELSSYAENALPSAARARYTEHLADCSSCRELVVSLSSSAGFVVASEPAKAPVPSGLRSFFASLFSPMVLRYSVPALGLIVVAVVGIGVWRRESLTERSLQMAPAMRNEAPVADGQSKPSPDLMAGNLATPASPQPTAPIRDAGRVADAPPPPPNMAPGVTVTAEVPERPAKKPEEQPAVAASAPAAAGPAATPAAKDEARQNVESEAPKQAPQTRVESAREVSRERDFRSTKSDGKRAEDRAVDRTETKAKNEPSESIAAIPGSGSIAKLRRRADTEDKDDAEVRAVAGRRFRRQDGIWVDTAYNSSKSATSVSRGSEQYRALVADEPPIKTIAEQLDGEIVVVWKGRAYRIR